MCSYIHARLGLVSGGRRCSSSKREPIDDGGRSGDVRRQPALWNASGGVSGILDGAEGRRTGDASAGEACGSDCGSGCGRCDCRLMGP